MKTTQSTTASKQCTQDTHGNKDSDIFCTGTQVLPRTTCTQELSITSSKNQLTRKMAQKRKGGKLGELTVDAVTKKLFQTPVKEDMQESASCKNEGKMETIDENSTGIKENVNLIEIKEEMQDLMHDVQDDDLFTIRKDSENLALFPTPVKENTQSSEIPEDHSSQLTENVHNSDIPDVCTNIPNLKKEVTDSDVESDQDVFSEKEEPKKDIEVGTIQTTNKKIDEVGTNKTANKKVSARSIDDVEVFSGEEDEIKKMKVGGVFTFNLDRNISDMLADALATTTEVRFHTMIIVIKVLFTH